MTDSIDSLVLDLLEWVGPSSRPYEEVMEAWRTSCPRLPVWEDANDRGFVARRQQGGIEVVTVTALGQDFLRRYRGEALTR